ncbi:MAG: polyprenyl diphosphate synthase [Myxococcota bacterium]
MSVIAAQGLPRHIGIIMDGNGRWAEVKGLDRTEGHRRGSDAVRTIVRTSRRIGIEALTLYAFSFQNWQRPDDEVTALMTLLADFLVSERQEILDNGIRLEAVGELEQLPPLVRHVLDDLRQASRCNRRMTLTLALSYGGQEEIARATQQIAREVAEGVLDPDAIDVDCLRQRVPSCLVGEPDLIIRTGGERRLSNFLLFGSAYAELVFSDALWPDFAAGDLFDAIAAYRRRQRRFGLIGEQVATEPAAE